jgi:antigen flippase
VIGIPAPSPDDLSGDESIKQRKVPRRATGAALVRALVSGKSGSMALAQTLIVRFLTLGLNVITGIISARFLGPVGRAEQAAILLGATFIPYLVSFGVPAALQFKIRTDPERSIEYVSAGAALTIALGCLAFVVGLLVLPHMLAKYPPSIIRIAQLSMLIAPIIMLYTLLCAILQARGRFREPNFTRSAMPGLTLVALCVLATAHALNAVSSSLTYLLTFLVVVPWLWPKAVGRLRLPGLPSAARGLLAYGSRSYVSDILGTLAQQVDQVLVIGLLSPSSMGLYAVALGAARAVDLYSASVVAVLFPRASSLANAEIAALTGRAVRVTAALLIATGILLIALMPTLLPLFYGRAFRASVPVAQVVVVSFVLNAVVYVLAQAFLAAGRPGVNAFIQLSGLAMTIPLMYLLIPRYGLLGAAIALVISTSLRLCSSLSCFPIILKVSVPSLILNVGDIRYMRQTIGHNMQSSD